MSPRHGTDPAGGAADARPGPAGGSRQLQQGFRAACPGPGRLPSADPLFPFTAGRLGSGANMSFDRDILRKLGGFDPAIGTGTVARGETTWLRSSRSSRPGSVWSTSPVRWCGIITGGTPLPWRGKPMATESG